MSTWVEHLADPRPITQIFGDLLPGSRDLVVHDLLASREGPSLTIRVDLREFPADPPKKWASAGYNRVQAKITAVGVRQLRVDGLSPSMTGDLSVQKIGTGLRLDLVGDAFSVNLLADALIVSALSAYHDTETVV